MKTFRINPRLRRSREFVELLYTLAIYVVLYLVIYFFSERSSVNIIWFAFVALATMLSRFLLPYHVEEITVDHGNRKIALMLKSRFTGRDEKVYELDKVRSEIKKNSGLGSLNNSGITLQIHLSRHKTFWINGRYGFEEGTLRAVDECLKDYGT